MERELFADVHSLAKAVLYLAMVVQRLDSVIHQAPVVRKVDNAIHRINHYPLDIAIGFAITYLVDSDLSGG